MKHIATIMTMALVALAPMVAKGQTTPFNSSAASPCPEVLIEQKYDHQVNPRYRNAGWDTAVTCAHQSLELSAEPYIPVQFFNGTYLVEQVPYNPPDTTFALGTRMPIGTDDDFAGSYTTIPYPFYFFGIRKNQFRLGANGLVTFCEPSLYTSTSPDCPWSYSAGLPWPPGTSGAPGGACNKVRDAIYGIYEDTNPSSSVHGTTGDPNWGIYYGIQDQFPCRKIICTWNDVPQYRCNSLRCTYQIVCYEGSNIIEVHVKQRQVCTDWQGGVGIIGIQNATGQPQTKGTDLTDPNYHVVPGSPAAFYPSGKNPFTTNMTETAYRFTPQGTTSRNCIWFRLMPNGDSIALTTNPLDTNGYYAPMDHDPDHPNLTKAYVSPKVESKYVCLLKFRNANNDWYHLFDTITVGIDTINDLQLTANQAGTNTSYRTEINICQGATAELPLHYTEIQQPAQVNWTIYRILNGQEVELDQSMINFTENDTAFTLSPDPNFEDLPKNKIDSIYVRAVVDFVSGCTNYDTMLVRIFPNFDTTETAGICRGQNYIWNPSGNNPHTFTNNTDPETTFERLTSEPGCDSVVRLNLTVFDVSHTVDPIQDCKPITWLNGRTYSTDNYATAAADTIRLQNRYGCDSIVQLDFHIYPLKAIISSSLEYFDYDHIDVELTDVSVGGDSRVWHFPTGVDQSARVAYYSIPVNLDTADIRMVAHSPYGCVDSTHIVIPFRKETMWMPNAFTPDNPAGNATFGSTSTKTIQQEMLIYNRYGDLVFRCEGVDCQWDGRDMNGKPCPQGAYAYIIRYTNQFEPQTTKILKGAVTLIR